MELRGHRMTIAACFAFSEKLAPQCFGDFFDSIDPLRTSTYDSRRICFVGHKQSSPQKPAIQSGMNKSFISRSRNIDHTRCACTVKISP